MKSQAQRAEVIYTSVTQEGQATVRNIPHSLTAHLKIAKSRLFSLPCKSSRERDIAKQKTTFNRYDLTTQHLLIFQ